jgi:Protein of unknown function (DUF2505)
VDFLIEHSFDADPATVADIILDENYQASLDGLGPLSERKVLEQKRLPDGTVRRRVRCVLDIDVSGRARRFIGDEDPAWIEHATWRPDERKWSWTIEPLVAKEMLAASGRIEIIRNGSRTVRVVVGEVKVKVPIVGGKVESWIVQGLERAYDEEARVLRKYLKAVPHSR